MDRADSQASPWAVIADRVGADDHLDQIWHALEVHSRSRRVHLARAPDVTRWADSLDIPGEVGDPADYRRFLLDEVIPGSVNVASPRCLGLMTAAASPFLWPVGGVVHGLNQNLVREDASPFLSLCERHAIAMLHRMVFGPRPIDAFDSSINLGAVTSGGSLANLLALWCARNALLNGDGIDVERDGVAAALAARNMRRAVIIGSELTHYSVDKAAALLGLGSDAVVRVPVDGDQRIDMAALAAETARCREAGFGIVAIVGIAGTTDFGSLDPLSEMAALASRVGTTFHVDASWGGALLLSGHHRHLLAGIELADMVTLDAHKQFQVPIGTGVLLFRDPAAAAGMRKSAQYILQDDAHDLGKLSVEGSRPGNSLLLHAALTILGAQGLARPIERSIEIARMFATMVRNHRDFELLAEPQTNIVVYRLNLALPDAGAVADDRRPEKIDALNIRVQRRQAQLGNAMVSRTRVRLAGAGARPMAALRAVFVKDTTSRDDLEAVLQEQLELGERIARQGDEAREADSDGR